MRDVWARVYPAVYVGFTLLWLLFVFLLTPKIVFGRCRGLAVVVAVAALLLLPGTVLAQYPDGGRDSDQWYYCHAGASNYGPSLQPTELSPIVCEHMLFQWLGGDGGSQTSVLFEGAVAAVGDSDGDSAVVRGWIVPPRGIKSYVFSCEATAGGTRSGVTGTRFSQARTSASGAYASTAHMSVIGPPLSNPESNGITTDVVSDQYATSYDGFYTNAPATTDANLWTQWAQYSWFEAAASISNNSGSMYAGYSCQILSWQSWPTWLATNPEWSPDAGDMVPDEGGGTEVGLLPIEPYPMITVPLESVVTTISFGIGTPTAPECYTIIPNTEQTVSTWFGDVPYGFEGVEACTTERSLELQVDEFNISSWAIGLLGFCGVGVLVSWLMRR